MLQNSKCYFQCICIPLKILYLRSSTDCIICVTILDKSSCAVYKENWGRVENLQVWRQCHNEWKEKVLFLRLSSHAFNTAGEDIYGCMAQRSLWIHFPAPRLYLDQAKICFYNVDVHFINVTVIQTQFCCLIDCLQQSS